MDKTKKRSSAKELTTQSKYITELQGNTKLKTLIRKYSKMDVVLAVDYLANAYPRMWGAANQKRKIHFLKEALKRKEERGYGAWERAEHYASKMGVKL